MALALPGVFTGIDSETIIAQLMVFNRRPLAALESRKSSWQAKTSAIAEIERRMADLKLHLDGLRDVRTLRSTYINSSDSEVVTATSGSGAIEGTHEVVINCLAAADKHVHDGVASLETLVGEGAFSYTYGGVTRTVHTDAETTLEDLCDLINNDAENPGVNASVLEYAADENHVYHLVLSGADTGADYAVTINDGQTTLNGANGTIDFRSATFTETQTARDAEIRVDGYPPGSWMKRSSNRISDVIPGVTLTLEGIGTATISIRPQEGQLATDLENLVSIYNGLVDVVDEYTGYDSESESGGVLQGDVAISAMLAEIRSYFVTPAAGFVEGQDAFTLPAHIGLEIDEDGKHLELDTSVLDDAIAEDYEGVLALIGALCTGTSSEDFIQFNSALDSTTPGTYEVEVTFDASGDVTGARIRTEGETEWRDLDIDGTKLTGQADNPEQGLRLTAVYPGQAGTYSGQVRIRQGFAGATYNRVKEILDATSGGLKLKKDHIQVVIDGIDRSIETQERRLEQKEERLREEYARLEALMARMDGWAAAFQSLLQIAPAQNWMAGALG